MKNLIFILLLFTLFCSCKIKNNFDKSLENKQTGDLYRVTNIDSLNSFYFIYCTKDEHKYKILSKKEFEKYNFEKLETGKYYKFELTNFPDYSENNNSLIGFSTIEPCFMLDKDTQICRENNIKGLYTTKNIIGLYYIAR